MNSSTQGGNRMLFENSRQAIIDAYVAAGSNDAIARKAVGNAKLTQSYLRLEQLVTTTTTLYNFPLQANQSGTSGQAQRPTEQRLFQQDAFYAGGLMMYIAKAATSASTNFLLKTYPNPITFPLAEAATGGNAFNTLYNGQMLVTVNNDKQMPAFDLSRFYQSPQTQLTGATNSPIDQFDGTMMEFLEPNPVFIGTKKNEIQITLPGPITITEATPVYIVLIWRGVLAQNVTIVS